MGILPKKQPSWTDGLISIEHTVCWKKTENIFVEKIKLHFFANTHNQYCVIQLRQCHDVKLLKINTDNECYYFKDKGRRKKRLLAMEKCACNCNQMGNAVKESEKQNEEPHQKKLNINKKRLRK